MASPGTPPPPPPALRMGGWARAGQLTGLVAAVADGIVTVFDPAERRSVPLPVAQVQPLPAGAVTVTVRVDLPLPHGLTEAALRRWVAALTDETLRERAYAALAAAGLDEGAVLPPARLTVDPLSGGAICLCGATTPAPPASETTCGNCGRVAVSAPASSND